MKLKKPKIKKEKLRGLPVFKNLKVTYEKVNEKIRSDLRYELTSLVLVCFIISFIVAGVSSKVFFTEDIKEVTTKIDIESVNYSAENMATRLADTIKEGQIEVDNYKFFNDFFEDRNYGGSESAVYLTDTNGKVIYKSNNATEKEFSIFDLISKLNMGTMQEEKTVILNDNRDRASHYIPEAITRIFPIKIENKEYYFIYKEVPQVTIDSKSSVNVNSVLGLLTGTITFMVLFLYVVNKKVKYIDSISDGIKVIAAGDLSYRVNVRGVDEISNIASNINLMAEEIEEKMESERKAERMKSELITNVSHDLRTPLTSIMGYIGLLKDHRYKSKEEMESYLEIAFNKSEKLKMLIEDLFEYTKLNNAEMKIEKTQVNLSSMVSQLVDEMSPSFDENNLMLVKNIVDEKIISNVDPDKMIRVFENLLSNAIKYSYKPGTVIIGCYENEEYGIISVRNRGDNIPKERLDKLFERFYRGDESRNGEVSGTGLGLAIAKSIITMHGGEMWAECIDNDITFYIKLKINKN